MVITNFVSEIRKGHEAYTNNKKRNKMENQDLKKVYENEKHSHDNERKHKIARTFQDVWTNATALRGAEKSSNDEVKEIVKRAAGRVEAIVSREIRREVSAGGRLNGLFIKALEKEYLRRDGEYKCSHTAGEAIDNRLACRADLDDFTKCIVYRQSKNDAGKVIRTYEDMPVVDIESLRKSFMQALGTVVAIKVTDKARAAEEEKKAAEREKEAARLKACEKLLRMAKPERDIKISIIYEYGGSVADLETEAAVVKFCDEHDKKED